MRSFLLLSILIIGLQHSTFAQTVFVNCSDTNVFVARETYGEFSSRTGPDLAEFETQRGICPKGAVQGKTASARRLACGR